MTKEITLNHITKIEGHASLNIKIDNGIVKKCELSAVEGSMNILLEKFIPDYKEIFDDIFISWIHFDEEGIIKSVDATEFDMEKKADALKQIASRENLSLSECVFIGDYLNDLKIIQEAGLGIAFNCNHDELKKAADIVIEKKDLREILGHILN